MTVAVQEAIGTRTKGRVLRQEWRYGETYLTDPRTKEVSLFVRRFREIEMPSGKVVLRVARDVEGYSDEDAMVAAIEERGMREWPELDSNPPLSDLPGDLFEDGDGH